MVEVLQKMITTPTVVSAASNFLVIFGDIVSAVMMLKGPKALADHLNWLNDLLVGQMRSLKLILNVKKFNDFDPKDLKQVRSIDAPALIEQDQDKFELIFRKFRLSGEDLVWVTVAKIHAYLDLLLVTDTITRQSARDNLQRVCLDYFLKKEVGRGPDCLRVEIVQLEELLRHFKYSKFLDKFKKKISCK